MIRGRTLIVAGVILFAASMATSAVLASPINSDSGPPGETLVSLQGGGPGLHEHGQFYQIDTDNKQEWKISDTNSYFGVSRLENNSYLAAFMVRGQQNCGPYDDPCTRTGFRVINRTPTPRTTFEYTFPVRSTYSSEVHDVERLPTGEYLVADMEYERVFTVNQNKSVTWQWNASSYYDAPADPTKKDWLHINDVDRIDDNRYLVSVRNANQLLIIERGEGVVEVINEDGDPSLIHKQHNPQWLGPNTILVADSSNDRIVELHRDNDSEEWTVAWSLTSAGGVGFSWPRDADRLPNSNTLITDTANQRIVEVTESGDVVWSQSTEYKPYEADRLPYGERVGGPSYSERELAQTSEIPVVTAGTELLVTNLPLPYWFGEIQLLLTLFAFATTTLGLGRTIPKLQTSEHHHHLQRVLVIGGGVSLTIAGWVLSSVMTVAGQENLGLYLGIAGVLLIVAWREIKNVDRLSRYLPRSVQTGVNITMVCGAIVLVAGLAYKLRGASLQPIYAAVLLLVVVETVKTIVDSGP